MSDIPPTFCFNGCSNVQEHYACGCIYLYKSWRCQLDLHPNEHHAPLSRVVHKSRLCGEGRCHSSIVMTRQYWWRSSVDHMKQLQGKLEFFTGGFRKKWGNKSINTEQEVQLVRTLLRQEEAVRSRQHQALRYFDPDVHRECIHLGSMASRSHCYPYDNRFEEWARNSPGCEKDFVPPPPPVPNLLLPGGIVPVNYLPVQGAPFQMTPPVEPINHLPPFPIPAHNQPVLNWVPPLGPAAGFDGAFGAAATDNFARAAPFTPFTVQQMMAPAYPQPTAAENTMPTPPDSEPNNGSGDLTGELLIAGLTGNNGFVDNNTVETPIDWDLYTDMADAGPSNTEMEGNGAQANFDAPMGTGLVGEYNFVDNDTAIAGPSNTGMDLDNTQMNFDNTNFAGPSNTGMDFDNTAIAGLSNTEIETYNALTSFNNPTLPGPSNAATDMNNTTTTTTTYNPDYFDAAFDEMFDRQQGLDNQLQGMTGEQRLEHFAFGYPPNDTPFGNFGDFDPNRDMGI